MGMFDTFLPDLDKLNLTDEEKENLKDSWWQTKSFENILTDVVWNPDDSLSIELFDRVKVPDERLYPNNLLIGSMRKVNIRLEPVKHDGVFTFYTDDPNDVWYEYEAVYENGKITNVKKIN